MGGAREPRFPIGDDEELCELLFIATPSLELRPQVISPAVSRPVGSHRLTVISRGSAPMNTPGER